jgi:hypothetical protein
LTVTVDAVIGNEPTAGLMAMLFASVSPPTAINVNPAGRFPPDTAVVGNTVGGMA